QLDLSKIVFLCETLSTNCRIHPVGGIQFGWFLSPAECNIRGFHQGVRRNNMAAICRFGMRMVPNISEIIAQCRKKKQLVQGPHIEEFEQEFLRVLGGRGHIRAGSTEYGRMALYFILKALNIPVGSEYIVPAPTFWVVPEITRVAGLKPVFADIDPHTFTMDPKAAERAITPNTRAILPPHLYGMSC